MADETTSNSDVIYSSDEIETTSDASFSEETTQESSETINISPDETIYDSLDDEDVEIDPDKIIIKDGNFDYSVSAMSVTNPDIQVSWVSDSTLTASWNDCNANNYIVTTYAYYQGVLVGSTTTGTTALTIDLQQQVQAILNNNKYFVDVVSVCFDVTPIYLINNAEQTGTKSTISSNKEYYLPISFTSVLPTPTNLHLTEDFTLSWDGFISYIDIGYYFIFLVHDNTNGMDYEYKDYLGDTLDFVVHPDKTCFGGTSKQTDGIHFSKNGKFFYDWSTGKWNDYADMTIKSYLVNNCLMDLKGHDLTISFEVYATDVQYPFEEFATSGMLQSSISEKSNSISLFIPLTDEDEDKKLEDPFNMVLSDNLTLTWETPIYKENTMYEFLIECVDIDTGEPITIRTYGDDTDNPEYAAFTNGTCKIGTSSPTYNDGIHHSLPPSSFEKYLDIYAQKDEYNGHTFEVTISMYAFTYGPANDSRPANLVVPVAKSSQVKSNTITYKLPSEKFLEFKYEKPDQLKIADDYTLNFRIPYVEDDLVFHIVISYEDLTINKSYEHDIGGIIGNYILYNENDELVSYPMGFYSGTTSLMTDGTCNFGKATYKDGYWYVSSDQLKEAQDFIFTEDHEYRVTYKVQSIKMTTIYHEFYFTDKTRSDFSEVSDEAYYIRSNKPLVKNIDISPKEPHISVGNSYYLGKNIYPINAFYTSLKWTSSDTSIVQVDNQGKITGISAGTAEITASVGFYASTTITVTVYDVDSNISIEAEKNSVSQQAGAIVDDIAYNDDPDVSKTDINKSDINMVKNNVNDGFSHNNTVCTDIVINNSDTTYKENEISNYTNDARIEVESTYSIFVNMYFKDNAGNNSNIGNITELNKEVSVSINISSTYDPNKEYKIIRVHDGELKELTCTIDTKTKTLTFKSDKFSDFILISTEQDSIEAFVDRLYVDCLNRASDPNGKAFWVSQLLSGKSGAEVAKQFFFSDELIKKNLSDKEFITRLYRTFMNREPDADGFKYWLNQMSNGKDRTFIFNSFINSTEWANICLKYGIISGGTAKPTYNKLASQSVIDFATRLYTTCLGRNYDTSGRNYWASELSNMRKSGTEVAYGFFFSSEFKNKCISDKDYIARLYLTLMGRNPDASGFNYWMKQLSNGMSREQAFKSFANTPEFKAICMNAGIIP